MKVDHDFVAVYRNKNSEFIPMCGICRCDAKIEEIKTDRLTTLNACCPKDMRHPVFWMPLIQYTHVTGHAII